MAGKDDVGNLLREWTEISSRRSIHSFAIYCRGKGLSLSQFTVLFHLRFRGGGGVSEIAEEFGITIDLIIAYNDIEDPNNVPIGTNLTIPEPDSELPTETPLPEGLQPGDKIEYVVKPGDVLALIAERFGTTVEAIVKENDIEDQNNIGAGTKLIITVGATATPSLTPPPGTPSATASS